MKHVLTIQEDLLKIFSDQLIPWARQGVQPIALARFPLNVPEGVKVKSVETPLLKSKRHRHSSNVLARWPDKALAALRVPHLGCVLEGEADLRIGLTESMFHEQQHLDPRFGQAILTFPARSWLLVPPGVPQSDGTRGHREPGSPPVKLLKILWISVLPEGLILHTCQTIDEVHSAAPGLFAGGTHFTRLIELWNEEMEVGDSRSIEVGHSLLLALLLSIERAISERPFVTVTNPEHLTTVSTADRRTGGVHQTSADQAVERALRYVNTHLHNPLSVKTIASHAYVSAPQLNRLFRSNLKTSVMKHVTKLRMESASSLLRGTDLSIREISESVGYPNRTYFSRVFVQETGVSPTAFRRASRHQKQ